MDGLQIGWKRRHLIVGSFAAASLIDAADAETVSG
jgi:hypothetical protein